MLCDIHYMYTPICASYNINILSRLLLSDFDQFVSGQIEEGICSPDSKQKLFYWNDQSKFSIEIVCLMSLENI